MVPPPASATPTSVVLVLGDERDWVPAVSSYRLEWYRRDGQTYFAGPTSRRWLATRSEISEVPDDVENDLLWRSTGYRRDRAEGEPDTLIGGNGIIIDMVDSSLPPLSLEYGASERAHDVDGDGTVDLLVGDNEVLLMSFDAPRVIQFPTAAQHGSPDWFVERPHPIPDLDGDGYAELFDSNADFATWYYPLQTSTMSVYDGGPNGYQETPRWSLGIEGGPLDVIAVQADVDPELELLALVADYVFGHYQVTNLRAVLIDEVQGVAPTATVTVGRIPVYSIGLNDRLTFLDNAGDVDGDGLDDVLLTFPDRAWANERVDLQLLSSAAGYDVDQPLASFAMGPPEKSQDTSQLRAIPVDIDDDGFMDLIAVQEYAFGMIQVWFGPLYEPPEPRPHTGDTGPADTGAPADTTVHPTADTGTAPDPTARSRRSDDSDGGCGCTAEARETHAPLTLATLLARRRW